MQVASIPKITDAEWEVMRVIWASQPVTSRTITEVLKDKMNWKPATAKTLIGRLVEKGFAAAEPSGNKYLYTALITEEESVKEKAEDVLSNVCQKKAGSILADLVQQAALSKKDIALLEEILQAKKEGAPDEVPCTCVPGQCNCQKGHGSLKEDGQ